MAKIPKGEKQLWQKKGGGSLTLGSRTIHSGEYFRADEKDIPSAFRDTIVKAEEPGIKIKEVKEPVLRIQRRSSGWFDVVDKDGKVQNNQALRYQEAEKLVNKANDD